MLLLSIACANLLGIEDPSLDQSAPPPGLGASAGNTAVPKGGGGAAVTGGDRGGRAGAGPATGGTSAAGSATGGNSSTGGVPIAACGVTFASKCLQVCADTHCCVEQQSCLRDAACGKLLDCSDACDGEPACHSACEEKYGTGIALVAALRACQRDQCADCPGPVMDNAILARAFAECSKFERCDRITFTAMFGTIGECVTRHAIKDRWTDALPGVAWTAAALNACASAYDPMTCSDYTDGAWTAACLFPGTLDLGESCSSAEQCRSTFCDNDTPSCGSCVAPPSEGGACVRGRCSAGFACNAAQVCQRARDQGEDCGTEMPCRPALSCYSGKCIEPTSVAGGRCAPSAGLPCDSKKSLVCGNTPEVCRAVTSFSPAGQSCSLDGVNGAILCAMGHCRVNTCVPLAKDHTPCDEREGPDCEWPARCIYGICRLESDVTSCLPSP